MSSSPAEGSHNSSPEDASPIKSKLTSQRSLKQLGLCAAGVGSIVLSTVITRRAVMRHRIAGRMQPFQQSNRTYPSGNKSEAATVAFDALQIATLNLASWALMTAGGLSWGLDVSSFEDLKRYTRRYTRGDPDQTDAEAEEKLQAELFEAMSKYFSDSQVESLMKKVVDEKIALAEAETKAKAKTNDKINPGVDSKRHGNGQWN